MSLILAFHQGNKSGIVVCCFVWVFFCLIIKDFSCTKWIFYINSSKSRDWYQRRWRQLCFKSYNPSVCANYCTNKTTGPWFKSVFLPCAFPSGPSVTKPASVAFLQTCSVLPGGSFVLLVVRLRDNIQELPLEASSLLGDCGSVPTQ